MTSSVLNEARPKGPDGVNVSEATTSDSPPSCTISRVGPNVQSSCACVVKRLIRGCGSSAMWLSVPACMPVTWSMSGTLSDDVSLNTSKNGMAVVFDWMLYQSPWKN